MTEDTPVEGGELAGTSVRIRGIYTTALTKLVLAGDGTVVQASPPIQERFDTDFPEEPADVRIDTTGDRQGVGLVGEHDAVDAVRDVIGRVGRDVLSWRDPAPAGAVADGIVDRTRGGGAIVDLPAGAEGYLPFDAVDGYVDVGDRLRVQVRSAEPPWSDDAPLLATGVEVDGGLLWLRRGEEGVSTEASGDDATELARSMDLLDADPPDGWGVRWKRAAVHAGLDDLGAALAAASDQAEQIDESIGESNDDGDAPDRPVSVATPTATAWCWFGRESRFALDEWRRKVAPTMRGHHRIKAGSNAASTAVDLVEAICPNGAETFPAGAVIETFGPAVGDEIAIQHGKPDGQLFSLGRGEVTEFDRGEGQLTVRREMQSSGTYDALGTDREPGDVAITKLKEGRWWYPTAYRGTDGDSKGTYINICTPVELFPDGARYVDLHVDVIERPDGTVERVDEDELDAAVEAGDVPEALAQKARSVAAAVERALA